MAAGKNLWQPKKWTGDARPNNPFYERSVRHRSCAFFFEIKKEKTIGGIMKTRRRLKEKLLAVLLALAMLLPAVPNLGMVDTAAAASAYTLHEANASGGDGDAYRFKSGKFMQIYVAVSYTHLMLQNMKLRINANTILHS